MSAKAGQYCVHIYMPIDNQQRVSNVYQVKLSVNIVYILYILENTSRLLFCETIVNITMLKIASQHHGYIVSRIYTFWFSTFTSVTL